MKIKKYLSLVWESLPFINKKHNKHFKDLEVGKVIFVKDINEDTLSPIVRVGFIRSFNLDSIIVYIPTLNRDCIIKYDGVNYYINKIKGGE